MLYALYQPAYDRVEINFELNDNAPKCVFGIVPRITANGLRKERFDVNTFTKQTSDSALPNQLIILSEHGDISRSVLNSALGDRIRDVQSSFAGFVLSDQPCTRPETIISDEHTILSFKYRLNPDHYSSLHRLSLTILDTMVSLEIRSDIRSKLSRNRDEVYAELIKEDQERKKEEIEQKKQEKRKAELEDRNKLSRTAQRKLEEKEQKKASRKKAAKMTVKMK